MKKLNLYIAVIAIFLGGAFIGSGYLTNANTQSDTKSYNKHFFSYNNEGNNHSSVEKHSWGDKKWKYNKSGYNNLIDINRQITVIDNGIILELTSSNAETVDKIQQFKSEKHGQFPYKKWKSSNITKDIELIDNGVRITITSDDLDIVTRLQEKSFSDKSFLGTRQHLKSNK